MPGQRRLNSRRRTDNRADKGSHNLLLAAAMALLLVLLPAAGLLAEPVAAPGVASPLVEDAPAPAGDGAALPDDRRQVFQFADQVNAHLQQWGGDAPGGEPYDRLLLLLPARTLLAYRDGRPVRAYPVAVGRGTDPTPTGSFKIINRVVDPTWYPRGAQPVPPGPDNPIGSRWLGLDLPGYGIHGTNNPDSIGRVVSLGCVRLLPAHVEELFDRTMIGTPVDIVYDRLWLQPSPDGREVLVGVFPDPYHRQGLAAVDVFARLVGHRPAGLPGGAVASWLSASAAGPALFVVGQERLAAATLNGRPLPGVEPVMATTEPWLPVAPLAAYVGARVQWLPSGELWVEGRPVPVRLLDGRWVAPARLLAQRLGLPVTALVDTDEALLVQLSGLGVFWSGQPQGRSEGPGGQRRNRPILVTRRAMHLAGGRLAVPAADLAAWVGADLEVMAGSDDPGSLSHSDPGPASPGPGDVSTSSGHPSGTPAGGVHYDQGGGTIKVSFQGQPVAWVTGPAPAGGDETIYLLLDSLAAAGAFTVIAHPYYPMVILQGPGRP